MGYSPSPIAHYLFFTPHPPAAIITTHMEPLSLNELAELLLVASYAETEALGHPNFFISLTEVAGNLGIEDLGQVVEACHLLEEKGYILLVFDHATALSATITPEGEACVASGGETGIIGEYQKFVASRVGKSAGPSGIEFETSDQPVPNSGFAQPHAGDAPDLTTRVPSAGPAREDLHHIIASLEMLVNNDASLSAEQKSNLVIDLKTLELQASRSTRKKPVIDAIASDLKKLPELAALVDLLIAKA